MDFLKAQQRETATITLGGESYEIPRQGLGGHYALESTMSTLKEWMEKGLYATVDCYFTWMSYATGFSEEWLVEQDSLEFAEAFSILVKLNSPRDTLPWMEIRPKKKEGRSTADYPNRNLAAIINRLAETYHWSQEEILDLPPEVAWCYVQEILLSEHDRREFFYGLSEVAYDKNGHYKDYQKPPWLRYTEGATKIPEFLRPSGNIIDLTGRKSD